MIDTHVADTQGKGGTHLHLSIPPFTFFHNLNETNGRHLISLHIYHSFYLLFVSRCVEFSKQKLSYAKGILVIRQTSFSRLTRANFDL